MPSNGSVFLKRLLDNPELKLTLENMSDEIVSKIELTESRVQIVGLSIAGFTAHLYNTRIQLFGKSEIDYLNTLDFDTQKVMTDIFLKEKPVAVVFTYPVLPPEYFIEIAGKYGIPIFSTKMTSTVFIDYIKDYLNRLLALVTTLHAQLIDVYGVGMLIMGESGIGKSETSMELVMRGHKLIADDVVEVKYIPPDHLVGSSNELMRNLMEIRGVGLVDLQRMFGVTSVLPEKDIDLVVKLVLWEDDHHFEYERIGSTTKYYDIFGVEKPYYVIPVRQGSNLSSIMEVISRDYLLKKQGINAAKEFENKLDKRLTELGGD